MLEIQCWTANNAMLLPREYQQNFDLNFRRALEDITSEEGYHVLESFCQNVEEVFTELKAHCTFHPFQQLLLRNIFISLTYHIRSFYTSKMHVTMDFIIDR